jgi:flagellar FliJ protein
MKPFALDTVLSYRQRLEDIATNNLIKARQLQQAVETKLSSHQEEYRELITRRERVHHEGINITELISLEDHISFTKKKITELELELNKKRDHVARTRKELLRKSRERQVMDKLKERQNAAWKQHLNKKEAAVLDEIAIIFHNK